MYCGQCGKKVMENMLYCPFCGSPIVIPEQDEPAAEAVKAQFAPAAAPESEEIRQVSLFDDDFAREAPDESLEEDVREEEEIPFEPLRFSFDEFVEPEADSAAEEEISTGEESVSEQPAPEPAEETPAPELAPKPEQQAPVSEPKIRPEKRRPETGRKREAKTLIPVKDVDVDNLFMDEESLEPEDEYDLDDDDYDSGFDQEFEFEEREEGGFFQRHIRGIVGLILMLILALILLIWAWSPKGQVTLAKLNLAWDAEVYADLGYESYQQESYLLAAKYYEKALARDEDNYDYAHSATVAYYEAEKIENAASMLKKCVELRPDSVEPYRDMMTLYPDPASRPWEISELIRMGYERTGDASLKIE